MVYTSNHMNPAESQRELEPCANCDLGNWRTCRCKYAVARRAEEVAEATKEARIAPTRSVVSPTAPRDHDRPVSSEKASEDIARLRKMLDQDKAS